MGSFYAMLFAVCAKWHSFLWTSRYEERWCLYESLVPASIDAGELAPRGDEGTDSLAPNCEASDKENGRCQAEKYPKNPGEVPAKCSVMQRLEQQDRAKRNWQICSSTSGQNLCRSTIDHD